MKSRSRPIPVILAIVHVITWKCAIFHSKSQNVRKIVIWELYGSHKLWNVKSRSRSIHVNFDHDPSLASIFCERNCMVVKHILVFLNLGSNMQLFWVIVKSWQHWKSSSFAGFSPCIKNRNILAWGRWRHHLFLHQHRKGISNFHFIKNSIPPKKIFFFNEAYEKYTEAKVTKEL